MKNKNKPNIMGQSCSQFCHDEYNMDSFLLTILEYSPNLRHYIDELKIIISRKNPKKCIHSVGSLSASSIIVCKKVMKDLGYTVLIENNQQCCYMKK